MVLVGVLSRSRIQVILSWCGPRNSMTTCRRRCVLTTSSWMTGLTSLWVLVSETHSDWVTRALSSLETRLKPLWNDILKLIPVLRAWMCESKFPFVIVFAMQTAEDDYEVRLWRDGRVETQILTDSCVTETVDDLYTQSTALNTACIGTINSNTRL